MVDVPRKSLAVLKQLLDHAGEVVTKDELAETCWPRRTVTDAVLATTVSRLRSALGDETLIQTVKGYGYRFVATASYEGPEPPVAPKLQLVPGDFVQGRPDWRLVEPMGGGSQADVWLARPSDGLSPDGPSADGPANRVFKFASDSRGVSALKREVAINRLLRGVAGEGGPFAGVLDWEFDHRPAFIAMPQFAGGNLQQWFYRVGGQVNLSLDQRIDLAAQCAEAVAVAHSAGVLHKDLKPANVLVDESGAHPRLYLSDFGSGTVMDRERLRQFALTRVGLTQIAAASSSGTGTPMYMAPEVLGGEPCSERSDIYALGILLYQLVIGDLRRPLPADWQLSIDDPLLREDIALCAAGDLVRRMASAEELARRLRSLPARRQQREDEQRAAHRAAALQKDLERHRQRRPWVIGFGVLMLIGLIVTSLLGWRLTSALETARRENAAATALNQFLRRDVLGLAASRQADRSYLSIREVMERAQEGLERSFAARPYEEGLIRTTLGSVWHSLADSTSAAEQLTLALEKLESAGQGRTLAAAEAHYLMGLVKRLEHERSREELTQAADIIAQLPGERTLAARELDARIRVELSSRSGWNGYEDQAINQLRTLVDEARNHFPAGAEIVAHVVNEFSQLLIGAGASAGREAAVAEEALRLIESVLPETSRVLGAHHPLTLRQQRLLANAYSAVGRGEEAIRMHERLVEDHARLHGPMALDTLHARKNLGRDLIRFRDPAAGVAYLRQVRGEMDARYNNYENNAIDLDILLVEVELERGRWEDAVADATHSLDRLRDMSGYRGPFRDRWVGATEIRLGYALARLGRYAEARPVLEQAQLKLPEELATQSALMRMSWKRLREVRDAVFGTAG